MVCQAIDGDLDREHARVFGALVQQIDDGLHAVVRVGEEDVVLVDVVDEGGRLFQLFGDGALEGRVAQRLRLFFGEIVAQRKEELVVEEVRVFKAAALVGIEKAQHEVFEGVALVVHLQAHHPQVRARFDLALHEFGKVVLDVGIIDAGVDIGIACDAHHHLVFDGIAHKGEVAERLQQLFHRHQLGLFAVADAVQPVGGGVQVHDADHAAAVLFQIVDHVVLSVFKLHHRMLGVQHHHGKQRQHVRHKVGAALLALAGRQLRRAQDAQARLVEVGAQLYVGGRAALVLLAHHGEDARQLLCRRQARLVVGHVGACDAVVIQAAHAHHKKFV